MKRKIRKRCKCRCGKITNYGKQYILGHNKSQLGLKRSEEQRLELSLSHMGNTSKRGTKCSKESKLKMSLAHMKTDPGSPYCEIWRDRQYTKDIRKDYCENVDCKKTNKRLHNHHTYLDKKRCAPNEVMTLCAGCHAWLHNLLKEKRNALTNPKDFIIINRPDHVSYIHKKSRTIIRINKEEKQNE